MKLSAPKMITFAIAIILGLAAIVLKLVPSVGASGDLIFLLAIIGLAVLALGNLVKDL